MTKKGGEEGGKKEKKLTAELTELTKSCAGAVWQGARRTRANATSCEAGLDRRMAGVGRSELLAAGHTGPGNVGVNSVVTHKTRES